MGSSISRSATRRYLAAVVVVAAAGIAHQALGTLASGATDVALAALAIGFSEQTSQGDEAGGRGEKEDDDRHGAAENKPKPTYCTGLKVDCRTGERS